MENDSKKGKSDFLIKKDKTKNKNWKETFKKLDFPFFYSQKNSEKNLMNIW